MRDNAVPIPMPIRINSPMAVALLVLSVRRVKRAHPSSIRHHPSHNCSLNCFATLTLAAATEASVLVKVMLDMVIPVAKGDAPWHA